ncbi:MAG: hypothetical protein E7274_02240 [Pseudobutyrivibrio ruminis]|nr:hypothetical protein [Pseudobutyrivibrio ruminis]
MPAQSGTPHVFPIGCSCTQHPLTIWLPLSFLGSLAFLG